MDLTRDILQEFKKITGQDIESFFAGCAIFFNANYNRIVAYYSGTSKIPEKGAFEQFEELERRCEDFFVLYQQMASRLNSLKWWVVLETLEEIDLRFKTLRKINKWSRSSLDNVSYDPAIIATYALKPQQTLERVAQDILGKLNPTDDWVDIALTNKLEEEDYTPAGGVNLQLTFPKINRGIQIAAVVDIMNGKSIYGKDIYRKTMFENDDLKVLDYDATILQAVEILAALKKNDNPEFPADGLQREVTIGGTRAMLNFPVIGRQMSETFATDDSLKNFQITDMVIDQDNLLINFQVQTRLNETQEGDIVV
jgi:hypothetical protein